MASTIVNFPYNSLGVARLDSDGVIHNHLYHQCPVGRIDDSNIIHSHPTNYFPVGRVDDNGYIYDNKNVKVGRVEGEEYLKAGSAFLLLINNLR
ncbi:hypothetical protein K0040_19275 [Terrisporobacter petrolearius]|uniref:hypothetical protein n=1 Tax=Terrisporobacter petrolearius TaxID=1460447 RepID=UPI001D1672E2|nr:hypothetical protein [Terrisporobacter petrolearius]MCC3866387.1 hypothetical protein [Terrisporobacter petrolearius]